MKSGFVIGNDSIMCVLFVCGWRMLHFSNDIKYDNFTKITSCCGGLHAPPILLLNLCSRPAPPHTHPSIHPSFASISSVHLLRSSPLNGNPASSAPHWA